MEKILHKYSPAMTPQNTGEADLKAQLVPQKAQARLDLHGYFLDEALEKTELFLEHACHQKLARVQIITGKGEILQYDIPRFVEGKKDFFGIVRIEKNEGNFEVVLRDQ